MFRFPMARALALGVAVAFTFQLGCSSDDNGGGPSGPGPFNAVKFDIFESDPLNAGYVFHLWAMSVDAASMSAKAAAWTSVTTFRTIPTGLDQTADIVTAGGTQVENNTFANLDINWEEQDSVYITIESTGSSPASPQGPVFLRGAIPDNLEQSAFGGLVTVFEAPGTPSSFLLATPTDDNDSNDASGVWFLLPTTPPQKSLNILVTPEGWTYEGWAWHDGTWLSTGTFTDPGLADGSAAYSATNNQPPPFPGEDFLQNHVSLPWVFVGGDSVKVTVEPFPDTDPDAPFSATILVKELPDDPETGPFLHPLEFDDFIQYVPAGNAIFKRSDDL